MRKICIKLLIGYKLINAMLKFKRLSSAPPAILLYILVASFLMSSQSKAQLSEAPSIVRVGIPDKTKLTATHGEKLTPLFNFYKEFWQIWGLDQQQHIEFIYIAPEDMTLALSTNQIDVATLSSLAYPSDKFNYSIPYLKYKQQVFRLTDADFSNGIQVAIHSANYKTLDFLSNTISKEYFFSTADLLSQHENFDAIYSVQPWLLAQELEALNLQHKFYQYDNESTDIFFHFITRKTDKTLGLSINESLRKISTSQAQAWQLKFFNPEHSLFSLTLGEYLINLSAAEKSYILEHNTLTYPLHQSGSSPYIAVKDYAHTNQQGFTLNLTKEMTKKIGLIFNPVYLKSVVLSDIKNTNIDLMVEIDSASHAKKPITFTPLAPNQVLSTILEKSLRSIPATKLEALYAQSENPQPLTNNSQNEGLTAHKIKDFIAWLLIVLFLAAAWYFYRRCNHRSLRHQAVKKELSLAQLAKLEAEKSAQSKISFLARMSHEIRTPMNGVLGMSEALAYTALDKNQKSMLETLNSSASNLLALLNDVLDFSKMDAGKLTLESLPVNLNALFTGIFKSFKHVENEKSIRIHLDIDSQIHEQYYTDPTRISQVLNNLLSNAIKFTHQGSVNIKLKLLEQENKGETIYDRLSISIQDTGIGIAPKKQGALFTPFIQADDDITRKFGGTGLGLSICHEIVTAMGSVISLESDEGKGCNFSFTLKLRQVTPQNIPAERRKNVRATHATDDTRFKHLKVLIAEDNLINIQVLCAQLNRLNITADIAYDGAQALDMHKLKPYDIIISDCHMPQMDGFELANILNQTQNDIPIWLIAITADALEGAATKCIAAGFDDYMAKPCPQEKITNKLNHAYRQLNSKRESYLINKLKEVPYVLFKPYELFLMHDSDIVLSRNLAEVFSNTWHAEKEHFMMALAQHNFSQIYALAHKQKSGIRYLCDREIESIVVDLETHAQSKNIIKTQKSCLLLIEQFDILHTEINHWIKTLSQYHQFFRLR